MRHTASREIRLEELDLQHAPLPDTEILTPSKRAQYHKLRSALEAYWGGMPPREVLRLHGVSRQRLSYHEDRFFLPHADGRVWGFRALISGTRIKQYDREQPSNGETINDGAGAAGSFTQLLKAYPTAKAVLDKAIARQEGREPESIALSLAALHRTFLGVLRHEGVGPTQYPLCTVTCAYQAMRNYVLDGIRDRGTGAARNGLFGHEANDGLDGGSGKTGWLQPLLPCDLACYDEQQLPAIGTVTFEHEGHRFVLPMERMSLCVLVSQHPKCILAYHLSHRSRVSSADFLETFNNLLTPWSPREFKALPKLVYKDGAGLPNGLVLGFLEGLRIGLIRLDNDLTHYADAVLVYLRELLGATIEFGKVGRWLTRYAVEQVFAALQKEISRLPSTTGSGPADRHVHDPAGNAVMWNVSLEELSELVEVIIANFNGAPRRELYGATPIEAVHREWAGRHAEGSAIPGYLPTLAEHVPLPVGICKVTIRGSEKKGVPPYIELDHAKYTSDLLHCAWHLIGTPMIALLQRDHRLIQIRYANGASFGPVNVTGHWSHSFHDRATRQEIVRLHKQQAIQYGGSDDPIEVFKAHKMEQMRTHANSNPGKVVRGSNKVLSTLGGGSPVGPISSAPAAPVLPAHAPDTTDLWTSTRLAAQESLK